MGRRVRITGADGQEWEGTLVPSHELLGARIVQLKLESGYNIGVRVDPSAQLHVLPSDEPPAAEPGPDTNGEPKTSGSAARGADPVHLLTTGGTIASRVDYRTGGVRPVHDERGILAFFPDLEEGGPVHVVPVFDRLSEEIAPDDWSVLAGRVVEAFHQGAPGVVVAHGTDTLAYSAAALSFLLRDLPGPVVVVGAQRSPDRPSSDGFGNMTAAVRVARRGALSEVVVLMHEGLSDDRFAIHRATRVRKMHSSRRDAFQSRNGPALGWVEGDAIILTEPVRPRSLSSPRVEGRFDPRGALLWSHPGLTPERAERFVEGLRGVILAGTGLGHVSSVHLPWIRRAVAEGKVVLMTTQCLEGSVDPYVYATGRELLRAGVLYGGDLLPETAYVKLLWALGMSDQAHEVGRLLLEDRAGEFEPRHPPGAGA
ncbi:MAG: Glu-tRNA(Gln) amidotransferase subunit GatD [Solirubrobacterales bacterium]